MANYRSMARRAAQRHGLDPDIFERQIGAESGFNPTARSPAGALGIAQIMPATARGWGVNPLNPQQALDKAAENMARYVREFGGYENALRAYNAGPGNVQRSHSFGETNNYVRTILNGQTPRAVRSSGESVGARAAQGSATRTVTTTTPGVDNSAERGALIRSFLDDDHSDILSFAQGIKALQDIPGISTTRTVRTAGGGTARAARTSAPSGGGGRSGPIQITGPNPGRIQPQVRHFMSAIAGVAGTRVVGSDGTGHSKYTTNGRVSEHYVGAASDIPAAGARLMALGRAALIAAGMPREQALRAPGDLYNLYKNGKRYQIIFGINDPARGGNHTDHLHVGVSSRRGRAAGR